MKTVIKRKSDFSTVKILHDFIYNPIDNYIVIKEIDCRIISMYDEINAAGELVRVIYVNN